MLGEYLCQLIVEAYNYISPVIILKAELKV